MKMAHRLLRHSVISRYDILYIGSLLEIYWSLIKRVRSLPAGRMTAGLPAPGDDAENTVDFDPTETARFEAW